MADVLTGDVEIKRIIQLLNKVLSSGDLSNYFIAVDSASDEDTKNVSISQLLAFAAALIKISAGDTTAGFLEDKLAAGTNITLSKLNPGANEQIEIAASTGGDPFKIESTSANSVAEFGNSGLDEFLTVISNLLKVAEFGDGITHRRLTLDPDDARGINTGLWFGGNDLGVYAPNGTSLTVRTLGFLWTFNTSGITQGNSNARISASSPSSTVPNIIPKASDADTGVGWAGADQLSLIAGAIEGLRIEEASGQIMLKYNWNTGVTASTTQSQGQQLLVSSRNEIATVANVNDVVTMPDAAEGREVLVVNNGANTLQIFPSIGDDLGVGVDASVTLASGSSVLYEAYNSTNWITK
jgi:hypothetical protein